MALTPLHEAFDKAFAQDYLRLEATRVHGDIWLRDPAEERTGWPFFPAHETTPEDGDVYTLQRDDTVWVWQDSQWVGPFTDLDTAMIAARMLG